MENAGIPTVVIACRIFRPRLEVMSLPRLLLTPYPKGRPLGAPGDVIGQRKTLEAALKLLVEGDRNGVTYEVSHPYYLK